MALARQFRVGMAGLFAIVLFVVMLMHFVYMGVLGQGSLVAHKGAESASDGLGAAALAKLSEIEQKIDELKAPPASKSPTKCPSCPPQTVCSSSQDGVRIINGNFKSEGVLPKILLLSPMRDSVRDIERYFRNIYSIDYPRERFSIGILEGDSHDGTYERLKRELPELKKKFHSVTLVKRDLHFSVAQGARHLHNVQTQRRAIIAKARNELLVRALTDEDWVFWLDMDVARFEPNILHRAIAKDKDILSINCVFQRYGARSYDLNNWQETDQSLKIRKTFQKGEAVFEGEAGREFHRRHLSELRDQAKDGLVPLDGVGGCGLLVRASVHRGGVVFPPFVLDNAIETEAFATAAKLAGVQPYGSTDIEIIHE